MRYRWTTLGIAALTVTGALACGCGEQPDRAASSSTATTPDQDMPKVRSDRPITSGGLPGAAASAQPAPVAPQTTMPAATPAPAPATTPPASPSATTPNAPPSAVAVSTDGKSFSVLGLTMPKPVTWDNKEIALQNRGMRVANFLVPGSDGGDQAELVIFRFDGDLGTQQMNIDRWVGQFRGPGQEPVKPVVEEFVSDGIPITIVELSGDYVGMAGVANNQLFFGAIVEAPAGKVYVRLVGDPATVQANREAFWAMLKGLKKTKTPASP